MIVLLEQKEMDEIMEMKRAGKSDKTILAHIVMHAKFDFRTAENLDKEQYPKLDIGSMIKK